VRSGETTTITSGCVADVAEHTNVVDPETGEKHGTYDNLSSSVVLMPGVYDLRFAKTEWRYIKVDGGKTTRVTPAQVILTSGLKWKSAWVDDVGWNGSIPLRRGHIQGRAPAGQLHRRDRRQQVSVPRHRG